MPRVVLAICVLCCCARLLGASPAMRRRPRLGGAPDRDDRGCARRPVHRHGAGARSGAHRRALRRRVPSLSRSRPIRPARRSTCARSRVIPQFNMAELRSPAAPPPTWRCSSSPRHYPTSSCRRRLAAARRVAAGETLTIAGFGVTAAGTARGLGIPRMATLTVTGKPGSSADPALRSGDAQSAAGLGGCTGDSGAPVFDGDRPAGHRRGELVDRAQRRGRLRRPDRRHAASALPRLDRRDGAQIRFAAGTVAGDNSLQRGGDLATVFDEETAPAKAPISAFKLMNRRS